MKLTFEKSDLVESTNIVLKAVSTKTTMPILTCILIEASGDEIKMTGNDMELSIETKTKGSVIEEGSIAVEAKLFSEIIRKLPDGQVELEEKDEIIRISCGKAHFNIPARSASDFTKMPNIETKEYICISEFTLKEAIRQTIFSISQNDTNKIMSGELFEINGDNLKVVSLDGHRISIRNIKLRESYEPRKVIVPGKTLLEISRIIEGDAEKDIFIFFSDKYIIFEYGTTVILSRLIEGEYFKVDKMISNDYETLVNINRKEFIDAIDRSLLLVRETDKKPIVFDINEQGMAISMSTVIGSMKESIDAAKEGKDIKIGFNPKFLADALRAIDDEEVSIYMVNAKSPCFIRDAENTYIYLILPINFVA